MRVFTTSKGVVAAAATDPAMRPITMSAPVLLSSLLFLVNERCIVRRVSYAANLTAMSGTSSRSVGMYPVKSPRGPAAAAITLGYTPACTERMHTAAGTLTIEEPRAPMPP